MTSGMHVLITGGAGYVGSHIAHDLAAAGHVPVVYDDLARGHRSFAKFGPLVVGALADGARLERLFAEYPFSAVIHCAALTYMGESMADPVRYFRNNTADSLDLIRLSAQAGVKAFVLSSTAAVYGDPITLPMAEDHPLAPTNPYGESKLALERMLHWASRIHGLPVMALRYFNAAGGRPSAGIGESHDPEPHLIPRAFLAIDGRVPPLEIFGTDYDTPDGTAIRDYIHVCDLARAHIKALDFLSGQGGFHAVNLGTGRGHSVLEVIAAVEAQTGRAVPRRLAPRRAGDAPVLVAATGRAQELLGWTAQHPGLTDIVADAWAWHQLSQI